MRILIIMAIFSLLSCGIKGDPVPPVEPTDWGRGLENEKQKKSEVDENSET